jgi:hypothetical protein
VKVGHKSLQVGGVYPLEKSRSLKDLHRVHMAIVEPVNGNEKGPADQARPFFLCESVSVPFD